LPVAKAASCAESHTTTEGIKHARSNTGNKEKTAQAEEYCKAAERLREYRVTAIASWQTKARFPKLLLRINEELNAFELPLATQVDRPIRPHGEHRQNAKR
jgi:hypothetical protein